MEFFTPNKPSILKITIPGSPKTKQGSNSSWLPADQGVKVHHYTPTDVRNWAAYAKFIIAQNRQIPLWDAAVKADILVRKRRPKSRKHDKYCTTKPDLDNITKNLMDSVKGIIISDDARVVDLHVRKEYSDVDEIYLTLELLEP